MAVNGFLDQRFLNSARLQRTIEIAASELERDRPLTFLDRLNLVNAVDDELMGRFTARQFAADVIADDQKAVVYDGGKIDVVTNTLPNIKIGKRLSQAMLNTLNRLSQGLGQAVEEDAMFDWETRFGEMLILGVRERMNEMSCAMMLDSYSYNRWGVKLTGATWGTPANLKVTLSPALSLDAGATANVANAKLISAILNLDRVDADNYGLGPFDRITMSSQAFDLWTQTTEFINRANMFSGINFALAAGYLAIENRPMMQQLVGKILGKEVNLDDAVIRTQAEDGTQATARVLPANMMLVDRKRNGDREWDFGNGVVTESIVAGLLGAPTLGDNPRLEMGGSYGPLGYYTAATPDMNAPGVNGWAVARGFPRKNVIECSAAITLW